MENLPCECGQMEYDKFFYELAHSFCCKGDLPNALKCFCDAFLVRAVEPDVSQDWLAFYDVQFSSYLLGKRRLDCGFPEGDMIYQLIRDAWIGFKEQLSSSDLGMCRNLPELAKSVEIDFPFELDVFGGSGQDDPESRLSGKVG